MHNDYFDFWSLFIISAVPPHWHAFWPKCPPASLEIGICLPFGTTPSSTSSSERAFSAIYTLYVQFDIKRAGSQVSTIILVLPWTFHKLPVWQQTNRNGHQFSYLGLCVSAIAIWAKFLVTPNPVVWRNKHFLCPTYLLSKFNQHFPRFGSYPDTHHWWICSSRIPSFFGTALDIPLCFSQTAANEEYKV